MLSGHPPGQIYAPQDGGMCMIRIFGGGQGWWMVDGVCVCGGGNNRSP